LKRTNRDKQNADDKMLADPLVGINDDGVRHHGSLLRVYSRRSVVSEGIKPRLLDEIAPPPATTA
jgi:hypothetical protein